MGDQIGEAVSGTMYYIPKAEFDRILSADAPLAQRAAVFATACRINTLYMIACAGSGHIGSSFSSMDIMSWLHLDRLRDSRGKPSGNVFFSSKGHDAPALYSVMIALGELPVENLSKLRRLGGLPGHPDIATKGIVTNTGSLGMGISKAKGMIFARKQQRRSGQVYVLTGDGELQEGQLWESLVSAANDKLAELTVIVDHNKLQSDTFVSKVSDLGNLEAKFRSFGWHACRCDGNNMEALAQAIAECSEITNQPQVIIADTVKGKGVSFMEHTAIDSDVELYKFHSGAPSEDAYARAVTELALLSRAQTDELGLQPLQVEAVTNTRVATVTPDAQHLIPAYGRALIQLARDHQEIVALDADLILDTGLIPFQKEFPDRFVECGIAEQDMVSQAGGMALSGLLPVVHSFGCFLTTRPNEQVYNNATERTKIIYVGSLSGVIPAGPGHSHQAVRDISALAAVPGLVMVEPADERETQLLLNWAVNENRNSTYIRLTSLPWVVPYQLPADYCLQQGCGVELRAGSDVVLVAYGPVMLSAACAASEMLAHVHGVSARVINLPWLNVVEASWLASAIAGVRLIVSIDNHYVIGGQGDRLAATIATMTGAAPMLQIGLHDIPHSGTNAEVLAALNLDAPGIVRGVLKALAQCA